MRITIGRGRARELVASALVTSAVILGAVPTAGLAVTAINSAMPSTGTAVFTPANVDPAIARRVAAKIAARGQTMRFNPAGGSLEADRTVTVAIRIDPQQAQAISVRRAITAAGNEVGTGNGPSLATLAPTRYNLGISRGYRSFAKPAAPAIDLRKIDMPDLATFRPREGAPDAPGRLQPRLALESDTPAGRAERTLEGLGAQAVDLGAGYRVGRNLKVTAGVRLSQDRNRLEPLTDAVRDDQAVYVGTQFRF